MRWLVRLGVIAFPLGSQAAAQDVCPPPEGRMVSVGAGVSLEVVEWSRAGEPLLFLSGLSKTAHAFDDLAPRFAGRYRAIGITRRGWGRSSRDPLLGYDSPRLIADIVAVLDSLAVPAAHVVGWSFGGHEAVLLAAEHPDRVLSVTLLDSYDNSLAAGTFVTSDTLPGPGGPAAAAPTSLRDMVERHRTLGFPDPVSELCATSRFAPDGRYLGPVSSDSVGGYTILGAARLSYSAVTQPVLAFYGTKSRVEDLFPAVETMDSIGRERALLVTKAVNREVDAALRRLRRALPSARVVEIPGANHAIFRSHPGRVLSAMRAFLAEGPSREETVRVIRRSDREIVVEGTFPGPASALFEAITRPEHLRRWMHAGGMALADVHVRAEAGGEFRYVFRRPSGAAIEVRGAYRTFDPPRGFSYLESYDFSPLRIEVTTALEPAGEETRLTQTLRYGSTRERDEDFDGVAASSREAYANLRRYLAAGP